ncbi:MAG: protein-(glutamine-N5) methyltransferase, release factor-specific [Anaerolineaceae bacterium]|nr:protein-(glutamine-N5) methyltransferase, release factor-specific [Anaerolineaceae bacterium]
MNQIVWQRLARMKINLGSWRNHALTKLSGDRDEISIAVNALLKKSLNKDQVWMLTNLDHELKNEQIIELENQLKRLINNEPLHYILEEAAFFGRIFRVSPDVLIPRPETELLVETVIDWAQQKSHSDEIKLLDIGTGSGCIPISILKAIPGSKGIGVDISYKALKVAQINAKELGVEELLLIQSDLISGLKSKFNVITANLPYIPTDELRKLRVAKFEPELALDGGETGLLYYERLFLTLNKILDGSALCIFEFHHDQGERIRYLAKKLIKSKSINILQDYAGFDRFIKIEV